MIKERESVYSAAKTTEKPACYDDRSTFRTDDRYIFISYSHADFEYVYSDLGWLYGRCLNFWYDKKLDIGDKWDERAGGMIKDANCMGAILFLSENSVKSEAVEKELRLFEEVRTQGKDFKIFPVIIGASNVSGAVPAAYASLADKDDFELEKLFPAGRVANILTKIPANTIYIERTAEGFEKLVDSLKNMDAGLFSSDEAALDELKQSRFAAGEDGFITLGVYPQEPQSGEREYLCSDGTILEDRGYRSVVLKKKKYVFTPLKWKIMSNSANSARLICDRYIDALTADELEKFKKDFSEQCIEEDLKDAVEKVVMPAQEEVGKADITYFASSKGVNSFIQPVWTERDGEYSACYETGKLCAVRGKDRCLVRPIIIIDIKKFAARGGN